MKHWIYIPILLLAGCGDSMEWVQDKIGTGPTAEQKAAAQEEKIRKIKVADDLVRGWADKLETKKGESGGYEKHQGYLDVDPWGNNLKVQYEQKGLEEIMTVRSPGPDGWNGTGDDIIHTRRIQNFMGWVLGNGWVWTILAIWVVGGVLSYAANRGWHARKKNEPHPAEIFACILIGPVALLCYVFVFFVSVVGSFAGDGIDLPDFD